MYEAFSEKLSGCWIEPNGGHYEEVGSEQMGSSVSAPMAKRLVLRFDKKKT